MFPECKVLWNLVGKGLRKHLLDYQVQQNMFNSFICKSAELMLGTLCGELHNVVERIANEYWHLDGNPLLSFLCLLVRKNLLYLCAACTFCDCLLLENLSWPHFTIFFHSSFNSFSEGSTACWSSYFYDLTYQSVGLHQTLGNTWR